MLAAVLVGRRALTMRNLAFAALAVIVIEPEQLAGASFQLSFAAVAALIAVQEARLRRAPEDPFAAPVPRGGRACRPGAAALGRAGRGVLHLLTATVFATLATASFMAAEFHELSPYVFVGNPLTLAMIEFFAVPGALLGTVLYPLGLDAPVWHWVGWGIRVRHGGGAACSAPRPCRRCTLRDLRALGLALPGPGAAQPRDLAHRRCCAPRPCRCWSWASPAPSAGRASDILVAPTGDALALRARRRAARHARPRRRLHGRAMAAGRRRRPRRRKARPRPALAAEGSRCDRLGCAAPLPGGGAMALVTEAAAFAEDCRRARILVTPLVAPEPCAAALVFDRLVARGERRRGAAAGRPGLAHGGTDAPPARTGPGRQRPRPDGVSPPARAPRRRRSRRRSRAMPIRRGSHDARHAVALFSAAPNRYIGKRAPGVLRRWERMRWLPGSVIRSCR